MSKENKIYTAADFQRYHSGSMPANEMHELEVAALEDAFLADALEGYALTPSFENDIDELKERLSNRGKNKKVFTVLSLAQSAWWRIAALLVIVAGAGYFLYTVSHKKNENAFVKNITTPSINKINSATIPKDSTVTNNDIAFENHRPAKFEEKKKNSLPLPGLKETSETFEARRNKEAAPVTAMKTTNDFADRKADTFDLSANDRQDSIKFLLRGKVTDEKGNPIEYALISNKHKSAVSDTSGYFLLKSRDSSITATITAVGFSPKKVTLEQDKEAMIALNKNSANLDEVTVTGYSSKNKKTKEAASLKELKRSRADMATTKSSAVALSNTETFDTYITENSKPVYNKNYEAQAGEVYLSFKTNRKGRPYNVTIVSSTCEACEEQAKYLLQNSPTWSIKKNELSTVVIKFQ